MKEKAATVTKEKKHQDKRKKSDKAGKSLEKKPVVDKKTPEKVATVKKRRRVASPTQFAKETRMEMQKVTWPTRDVVVKATMIILVIVALSTLLVGVVDVLFARFIILLKETF